MEGQAQALDKLLDAKKAELERLIERSSSAGATAGTGRVLARADGHHCAVTFETGLQAAPVLGLAVRHYW